MVRVARSKILVTESPTKSNDDKNKYSPVSSQHASTKATVEAAGQSPKEPALDAKSKVTKKKLKATAAAAATAANPKAPDTAKSTSKPITKREKKMTTVALKPKKQQTTPVASESNATSPKSLSASRPKVAMKSAGRRLDLAPGHESAPKESEAEPGPVPANSPKRSKDSSARKDQGSAAPASPKKTLFARRQRVPFTEVEVDSLKQGVNRYGFGAWADILQDPQYHFNLVRTAVDLKDKWRNINGYRKYSEHQVRRYMLLDENHRPVLSRSGRTVCFNNRWPRDAAMKVASRAEYYAHLEDTGPIIIYLKEARNERDSSYTEPVVHVYSGQRTRIPAIDIKKFESLQFIWRTQVRKIRTEMLSYDAGAFTEPILDH